jgi:hypothetical protein
VVNVWQKASRASEAATATAVAARVPRFMAPAPSLELLGHVAKDLRSAGALRSPVEAAWPRRRAARAPTRAGTTRICRLDSSLVFWLHASAGAGAAA